MSIVTFADCRAAARTVRRAEYGRQSVAVVRPRSVLGIVRSRGPLALVLFVAAAEGRFVRPGPDSFALLERPLFAAVDGTARGPLWLRLLRVLDRRWDLLVFAVAPIASLLLAGTLMLVSVVTGAAPSAAVVWLALAALVWIVVFMAGGVVLQSDWARRTLGRRPPAADEIAAESLPGWNWSMPLCHHTADRPGRELLDLAADRMAALVQGEVRLRAADGGAEPDGLRVREVLVCLTEGVTTATMRATVRRSLEQPYGPGSRVALRMPRDRVEGFRPPEQAGGGFFFVWLGGVAAIVAMLATVVPAWERAACPAGPCGARPVSYGDALHWLAWRLLGQEPTGVVPHAWQTLVIGWLLTVVGGMTVPVAWVSVRLAVQAQRRAVGAFQRHQEAALSQTRLMLLTTTPVERDAVLAAMRAVIHAEPERSFTGNTTIYELGSLDGGAGRTAVGMAQCARMGAGGPGGAQATAADVINRWRPDLVIMVGICYGLREDWTPPQRLADVVVATSIYDLDKRIEYDDRTELLGDRVATKTALIQRLQAASTDWSTAPVHFGLLLSAQVLVDSADRRKQLKREHSRALGGEMEGHGLYAAAADANVPWIVVKAISDWGIDRETAYRPHDAAANAASFVAHAIGLHAFARP